MSDRASDASLDDAVFALINPDGSYRPGTIVGYFLRHPGRIRAMVTMSKDARLAAENAAAAACVPSSAFGRPGCSDAVGAAGLGPVTSRPHGCSSTDAEPSAGRYGPPSAGSPRSLGRGCLRRGSVWCLRCVVGLRLAQSTHTVMGEEVTLHPDAELQDPRRPGEHDE